MNRLDLPVAASDDASALNQRWLAARLAHWQRRLAQPDDLRSPEPPPFDDASAAGQLARLFALSPFERELLVLAAGVEIDTDLRDAVAQAQATPPGQPLRLNFALALSLLPQPHWDALGPQAPLRHWRLLDVDTTHGFAQAGLRIDERVLHHLTGVAAIDTRLAGIARFDDGAEVDAAALAAAEPLARAFGAVPLAPLLMLADAALDAPRRRAAQTLAAAVFAQVGLRTLWVDAEALPRHPAELTDAARLIDREAALAGAGIALLLALTPDADASGSAPRSSTQRLIAQTRSPVLLLGVLAPLQAAELTGRSLLRFNLPAAALPRRAALHGWPPALQRAAERAAQQFRVDPALVDQVLAQVPTDSDAPDAEAQVWNGLREAARGGLDTLAQRVNDGAGRIRFSDLVLPAAVLATLREMAAQLRHRQQVHDDWGFGEQTARGLGMAALFSGDSGTGKTLAAEAVANEAGLDLYRIDLANVVNKYIGETEKNLARLFDEAERSGAVLLFDEADALFGKRSEVKDSHDRHANIEVAYLLQRIESYRGLAILTSNLKSTLDTAFLRRLRFVVQFPFPDAAAREQIWRRQFPPRAPLGAIDFAALARLQLSGGNIRSVALNAAFAAAACGEPIGDALLLASARAEFAKLERHFGGTR